MFLLVLIPFWGALSYLYQYQSLKNDLKLFVDSSSEDLSFYSISQKNSLLEKKFYKKLEINPFFLLVSTPRELKVESDYDNSSFFVIPIKLYNIPAGNLVFKPKVMMILLNTLKSTFFISGFSAILLITMAAWNVATFITSQEQKKQNMESLIQFKKTLIRHIIHDLKSPLTLLNSLTYEYSQTLSQAEHQKYLTLIYKRFRELISQLQIEHIDELTTETLSTDSLEENMKNLNLQIAMQTKNEINFDFENRIQTDSFSVQFSQVSRAYQNVLLNSCEANNMNKKKDIKVKVTLMTKELLIEIEDQGKGFTGVSLVPETDPSRLGRGIGLFSIQECLHSLKGMIQYKRLHPFGTQILMKIPIFLAKN